MPSKKLKPLDLKEDVERYEARSEQKDVKFERCDHKDIKAVKDRLICSCGAVFTGSRLKEIFDFFTKKI